MRILIQVVLTAFQHPSKTPSKMIPNSRQNDLKSRSGKGLKLFYGTSSPHGACRPFPGRLLGGSWVVLGASWGPFGQLWVVLGTKLGRLGVSRSHLGGILEASWRHLAWNLLNPVTLSCRRPVANKFSKYVETIQK